MWAIVNAETGGSMKKIEKLGYICTVHLHGNSSIIPVKSTTNRLPKKGNFASGSIFKPYMN